MAVSVQFLLLQNHAKKWNSDGELESVDTQMVFNHAIYDFYKKGDVSLWDKTTNGTFQIQYRFVSYAADKRSDGQAR